MAVDDAHWADGNSLMALAAAVRQLRNARVAFVVTAAQGVGEPPRELLHLQADVGRGLPGATVRLDALDPADLRALVTVLAPWCQGEVEADRLNRRLAFETAGNPFFAVTLLTAFARATTFRDDLARWPPPRGTYDVSLPFSIPSLVRMAIAVRVGELSKEEQAILRAASAISEAVDLDLVSLVSAQAQADVESAVPAFERRGFVTFDGQRYVFTAPIVREVVRTECLSRGQLHQLERRAVEALSGRDDLESRALRADLLAHLEGSREALEAAVAVARDALDAGAIRLAKRAFIAAERLSGDLKLDRPDLEDLRRRL
jgi:predicted ATPase